MRGGGEEAVTDQRLIPPRVRAVLHAIANDEWQVAEELGVSLTREELETFYLVVDDVLERIGVADQVRSALHFAQAIDYGLAADHRCEDEEA